MNISFVVPVFNEQAVIGSSILRILAAGQSAAASGTIELILVDDGSSDQTWEIIQRSVESDERVVGIRLSRNFGQQAAITCGYSAAAGDAVICLDADLQDPPELFGRMIDAWRDGAEVVFAVRSSREGEGIFKRFTAWLYYRLLSMLSVRPIVLDAGEFRLLGRRALEAILAMPDNDQLLRATACWIGFPTATITYRRAPRQAGQTKYGLGKMVQLAWNGIFATERGPTRLAHGCAMVGLCPFLLAGICLLYFDPVRNPLMTGFARLTIFLPVVLPFFIYLGTILEYAQRSYERLSGRPSYIVQEVARKQHDTDRVEVRV